MLLIKIHFFFYSKVNWIHFPWATQSYFTKRGIEIERYYDRNKYNKWRIRAFFSIVLGSGISLISEALFKRKFFYSLLLCLNMFLPCCCWRNEDEISITGMHVINIICEGDEGGSEILSLKLGWFESVCLLRRA